MPYAPKWEKQEREGGRERERESPYHIFSQILE
jgi:hypothetical protein